MVPPTHPDPGLRRRAFVLCLLAAPGVRAADAFEWRPWPDGKRVPVLDLPRPDGRRWRLADERGQVVLVNFWASWCAPCRDEMPSLLRLVERRAAEGVVLMSVNYRESAATVARYFDGLGQAMPTVLDADGAAAAAYTPRIFPSTVVFDRRGRPVGTVVGEIDWDGQAASRLLAPVLAAP